MLVNASEFDKKVDELRVMTQKLVKQLNRNIPPLQQSDKESIQYCIHLLQADLAELGITMQFPGTKRRPKAA
jgi:hypothetical protein